MPRTGAFERSQATLQGEAVRCHTSTPPHQVGGPIGCSSSAVQPGFSRPVTPRADYPVRAKPPADSCHDTGVARSAPRSSPAGVAAESEACTGGRSASAAQLHETGTGHRSSPIPRTDWSGHLAVTGHRAADLRTAGRRSTARRAAGQRPAGQRPAGPLVNGPPARRSTACRPAGQRSASDRPVTGSLVTGPPVNGRSPVIHRSPVTGRSPAGQRLINGPPAYSRWAYSRSRSWRPSGHPRRRDSIMKFFFLLNEYDSDGESAKVLSTTFQTSSCW